MIMRRKPTVTKNLLIINVIAFLATVVMEPTGFDLNSFGGLHFFLAEDFHLWQLVSYQFLHANFVHILFNMFAVWMFGTVIENVWGPRKFLFYYLTCGIGAGLMQEAAQFLAFYSYASEVVPGISFAGTLEMGRTMAADLNNMTTIGASGAVYAVLLAFGMIFPEERIFIFPLPIPIKAKWFVIFYVILELFSALNTPGDGVAHTAHLGGMLFGFLMIRYWNKHPGISGNYGTINGKRFFDTMKENFDKHKAAREKNNSTGRQTEERQNVNMDNSDRADDWEFNERKRKRQEEIDKILDKIRKSGYDSLTAEEKKKLFDSSQED